MAFTVIRSESFAGVGTVTGTTANLGVITGTFNKVRYGPRDTLADVGWSTPVASGSSNIVHRMVTDAAGLNVDAAGANAGVMYGFDAWYYLGQLSTAGAANSNTVGFAGIYGPNGNPLFDVGITGPANNNLRYRTGFTSTWQPADFPVPFDSARLLNRWFCLRVVLRKTSAANTYDMRVLLRFAQDAAWTELLSVSGNTNNQAPVGTGGIYLGVGYPGNGQGNTFTGRYGRPTFFTLTDWANDPTSLIPGLLDPPPRPYTWYVDPTNGDDTADGSSPATAWRTLTRVSQASSSATLTDVTYANAWVTTATPSAAVDQTQPVIRLVGQVKSGQISTNGDTIVIQANGGGEQRAVGTATIWQSGVWVRSDAYPGGRTRLTHFVVVPAVAWSLVPGEAAVWRTPVTVPNLMCFQDRRYPVMLAGANLAAVLPTLRATAGGCYCDGAYLYFRPFDGVDPTVPGPAVFERSQVNSTGVSGIELAGVGGRYSNIDFSGTAISLQTDAADGVGGYGFGASQGGFTWAENSDVRYYPKHASGWGTGNIGIAGFPARAAMYRCDSGAAPPLQSISAYVCYSGQANTLAHQYYFEECDYVVGRAVAGSTDTGSTNNFDGIAFINHSTGGGVWGPGCWILNCDWRGGGVSIQNDTALPTVVGCKLAGGSNYGAVQICTIYGFPTGALAQTTYTDCHVILSGTPANVPGFSWQVQSANTVTLVRCTVDLSACNAAPFAFYWANSGTAGPFTVAGRDNLWILPANGLGLWGSTRGTQIVLASTNDRYIAPPNSVMFGNRGDGQTATFAQAGTYHATSANYADYAAAGLDAVTKRPLAGSPLISAATAVVPGSDATAVRITVRDDIGAYESGVSATQTGRVVIPLF